MALRGAGREAHWNAGSVPIGSRNIATKRTGKRVLPIMSAAPSSARSEGTTMWKQRSRVRDAW